MQRFNTEVQNRIVGIFIFNMYIILLLYVMIWSILLLSTNAESHPIAPWGGETWYPLITIVISRMTALEKQISYKQTVHTWWTIDKLQGVSPIT